MSAPVLAGIGKLNKEIGELSQSVRKDEAKRAFIFTMGAGSGALLEDWLQNSGNQAAFNALFEDGVLMDSVVRSSTTMNAVTASSTAMDSVAASSTFMNIIVASSTLMDAVAASSVAMNSVAASNVAMNIVAASATAMNVIESSEIARDALYSSSLVSEFNFIHGGVLPTTNVTISMPSNVVVVGLRSTAGSTINSSVNLIIRYSTYGQTERTFNIVGHTPNSRVDNFPIMLMQGVKQMRADISLADRGWVFRFIEVNL